MGTSKGTTEFTVIYSDSNLPRQQTTHYFLPRPNNSCLPRQMRQSGLKSEGRGSGLKNRLFQVFFLQKIRIFQANLRKISIFRQKLVIYSYFPGKLLYFSSKVTTFQQTSCAR